MVKIAGRQTALLSIKRRKETLRRHDDAKIHFVAFQAFRNRAKMRLCHF